MNHLTSYLMLILSVDPFPVSSPWYCTWHFTEVSKWLPAEYGCAGWIICYQNLMANTVDPHLSGHQWDHQCVSEYGGICSLGASSTLPVGMVMWSRAVDHEEGAFLDLSIALWCWERLVCWVIVLIYCTVFESTRGGAQSYENGRWASGLSAEFCTVRVLLGLGNLSTLHNTEVTTFQGFHCSQACKCVWDQTKFHNIVNGRFSGVRVCRAGIHCRCSLLSSVSTSRATSWDDVFVVTEVPTLVFITQVGSDLLHIPQYLHVRLGHCEILCDCM